MGRTRPEGRVRAEWLASPMSADLLTPAVLVGATVDQFPPGPLAGLSVEDAVEMVFPGWQVRWGHVNPKAKPTEATTMMLHAPRRLSGPGAVGEVSGGPWAVLSVWTGESSRGVKLSRWADRDVFTRAWSLRRALEYAFVAPTLDGLMLAVRAEQRQMPRHGEHAVLLAPVCADMVHVLASVPDAAAPDAEALRLLVALTD